MRWLLAPLLVLSFLGGASQAQQISDPVVVFNPHGSMADMMNLWDDDAPWTEAMKKTKVVILLDYWINAQPIADLTRIVEFTKRHHMTIMLSIQGVVINPSDGCGSTSEGYTDAPRIGTAAKILKSLNADVSHVEVDEPLWFGTYSTDPAACHFPLEETIRRTALGLQGLLDFYPHVIITQIEPVPAITRFATWRQDMTTLQEGLAKALGSRVHTVQLDVDWPNREWRQSVLDVRNWLRQRNIGLGIIYNGSPVLTNDLDWINSAIDNTNVIEGELHIVPDMASFQTWSGYPNCNLPESAHTSLTWWINRYFRPRTSLSATFQGQGVHGKLTTPDGKPVANAIIKGYKPGIDFARPLPTIVMRGVVPANAVTAIIGVRLNAECANCNGLNDLLLGTIQYQEIQGGTSQLSYSLPSDAVIRNGAIFGSEIVGGISVTRIITEPGQQQIWNSPLFPVSANAKYVFSIPAGTIGGLGWHGNIIIIWIDAQGNGSRLTVIPDPGKAFTSSAVTAADGTFALPKLPRSVEGPNPVSVEFEGAGGAYRAATWTPFH